MPRCLVTRLGLLFVVAFGAASGCVRRTVTITTEPPGALVWLNDREVGRSPIEVDFDYYGTYDVRLERDGYEPMMTSGHASAPWWETVGLDLLAELTPVTLRSRVAWHYVLEPLNDDRETLVERARDLRQRVPDPAREETSP